MKVWIPKNKIFIFNEFPEKYNLIINNKLNEYLLYISLKLDKLEYSQDIESDVRIKIIYEIFNVLYTNGIDAILQNINDIKYQTLLSIILSKIKDLKNQLDVLDIYDLENKNNLKKLLNKVYYLIKNKLTNFNLLDDIKHLILEFY